MKDLSHDTMTIGEMVRSFKEIALEQDAALLNDQTHKYNVLYDRMLALQSSLKALDGDQRRALTILYENPNAQVRLQAALATLATSPQTARSVLQEISDRNEYPQAIDARGMIRALDNGSYQPI